MRGAD